MQRPRLVLIPLAFPILFVTLHTPALQAQQWTPSNGRLQTTAPVQVSNTTDSSYFGLAHLPHSDAASAIRVGPWSYLGYSAGSHYPYWSMNAYRTLNGGWNSYHPSLRGSIIHNSGNSILFSSTAPNTPNAHPIEHMRINTLNGRVGIGVTDPQVALDIAGTIHGRSDGVSNLYSLKLRRGESNLIYPALYSETSNGTLIIGGDGNGNGTVALTNTVGIGTTTTSHQLTIDADANTNARGILLTQNSGSITSEWKTSGGGGTGISSSNAFNIFTGGSAFPTNSRLHITAGGKVGIGSTQPLAELDITTTGVSHPGLAFNNDQGYPGDIMFFDNQTLTGLVRLGHDSDGGTFNFQSRVPSAVSRFYIKGNGNVGIGTTNPDGTLHVNTNSGGTITPSTVADDLIVENNGSSGISILSPDINNTTLDFGSPSDADYARLQGFYNSGNPFLRVSIGGAEKFRFEDSGNLGIGAISPDTKLSIEIASGSDGNNDGISITDAGENLIQLRKENTNEAIARLYHGGSETVRLRSDGDSFFNGGNVGIGTDDPQSKLAVDGTITSKEVVVTLEQTAWPDYVLADNYVLRSLEDVEQFIDENGHLPEVPSAEEVAEEGVTMGAMQATLLKKIEELTLYLIDMKQEVDSLQAELKAVKSQTP